MTWKKIHILCEGQTEEMFVKSILKSHLSAKEIDIIPTILATKRKKSGKKYKGGVSNYARIRKDVINLLKDRSATLVTTLIDYYGLPKDFPGKNTLQGNNPYERVSYLEKQFKQDINNDRFRPFLILHEFEALLFTDVQKIIKTFNISSENQPFGNLSKYHSPEEINEGKNTHPSARISSRIKDYQKVLHGLLIIKRIGLTTIRSKCPHFDSWLKVLETT